MRLNFGGGMALKVSVAPSLKWTTLQAAKDHLRVTDAGEDAYIVHLINAVQAVAQQITRRTLLTTTYLYYIDVFPSNRIIEIPKPLMQSLTHVKYFDTSNVQQTLAATQYDVDTVSEPARIIEASGKTWPSIYEKPNAIEIKYVAGWLAASEIPAGLVQGMYYLLGFFFDRRDPIASGSRVEIAELPFTMKHLFSAYKVASFY